MATIREDIVNNGFGALNNVKYIVIHETGNSGATAQNHRDYWRTAPLYAHAVCDWKEIIHTTPYNRMCPHVGNANGFTIGLEICHATNKADFDKAWKNAIAWTKAMMKQFGLTADKVVSHDYCREKWGGTDHTDPTSYFKKYGKTFADFVKELGGTDVKPAQSTTAKTESGDFEGGKYKATTGVNIRSKPSKAGVIVGSFAKGADVILDDWYTVADGYVWGRYTAYSGYVRYVAVGPHTGKPESNDYLVKA